MSMNEYGFFDYGMIIDSVAAKEILGRGGYEDLGELWDEGRCQFICEFTGAAHCLDDYGHPSWKGDYIFEDDELYYVPLSRTPSLCCQAYSSVDEIVEETKFNLNDLLPEDFDIRNRLCLIEGTCWI